LTAEQANLSTASCTAVRKLYWQDWFLYQQQCLVDMLVEVKVNLN